MSAIKSITDLLRHHAEVRGQRIAFSASSGVTVNYAELNSRTSRIASHLVQTGLTRGQRVAIVLGSCIEAVESTFAVVRAAAVGLPLDARSSQAELARAFDDSCARVVITDSRRFERVRKAVVTAAKNRRDSRILIVVVDHDSDLKLSSEEQEHGIVLQHYEEWVEPHMSPTLKLLPPPDDLGLDEVAWLHYTTGTTGQPKGVLTCQRSWMWTAVNSYATALDFKPGDKLFWPLPLFHAFGQSLCVIGTLAVGATTHLVGDKPVVESLLQQSDSTIIAGAPATFRELVTSTKVQESKSPPRPRACVTAGAPPPTSLNAQVEALFAVPLLNHYGCTECGMIATTSPGDSYVENSCGPPVQGIDVQLRPVTQDGQISSEEIMDDAEGEICVRTPSFMLGYNGQNASSSKTKDGWYRTGDLGRWLKGSGSSQRLLSVTGRLKELIIRGGENIHPSEVEEALRACPNVADVVVTGLPHDMLGEVPAAFVVPKPNHDLNVITLLKACRAALPDYKVPVSFYAMSEIPHTASGKPKRLAVVELLRAGGHCRLLAAPLLNADAVQPLVLAEVLAVCGSDFGVEQIDLDTSFKALGLNSLKSVVLRDRLATLTGLDLPLTLVFEHPTPAAVCQLLQEKLFGLPTQQEDQSIEEEESCELDDSYSNRGNGLEPIAIVSMDCRYPGGISSPEDLWHAVSEGLDMSSDFPTNRGWDVDALYNPDPNQKGCCTARRGGFLHDMADFDAPFFGMSPREALSTDPQQRLLLETTHTLIERAGIPPSSLRGTDTGVFVGLIYSDYVSRFNHGHGGQGHEHEAHLDIGSSPSVAAGRISYSFDFKGPSMAIDAACSSSLTAIHLAAQSLQTGESRSYAIAGGVTLMSTPRQFIAFSRQRGLSSDGRCRPYSADANGTGWSEGVGLLLLERLSDARRNGHKVLGLVRGSAVNSDGTSNGLTAPSGPAQHRVISQALSRGGLSPKDVDVLDGHGTATSLGDPIELRAIAAAYGDKSRTSPLLLGSLKSNLGHTQAAAGVGSVMKLLMSMEHGVAPKSLNISKPSPYVDWESGGMKLLTEAQPWPQTPKGRPRRAAVSSFGISGTNAHVIIEHVAGEYERKRQPLQTTVPLSKFPWLLSAADDAALKEQASALASLCKNQDALDVAYSLAVTRSALPHRVAVSGKSGDELYEALMAFAEGRQHVGVSTGIAKASRSGHLRSQSKLAFVFSGQGSQRLGMGQRLRARFPRFAAAFDEVCRAVDPRLERPLSEVIDSSVDSVKALFNRADFAHVAVFAFEVAMFRLLESFGIRPDYVAGHSLGEVAAAHAAGHLSLTDAAVLVTKRGALMAALPENGTMVSVSATEDEVKKVLQVMNANSAAVVAAVNGQNSVVVSGPTDDVLAIKNLYTALGRSATQLRVSRAFHSPLVESVLPEFGQTLRSLSMSAKSNSPKIPLVSTVTGKLIDASELTVEHWMRHIVAPVRFADAIKTLSTDFGVTSFVEVGPSAPLANYMPEAIVTSGSKKDEVDILQESLGQMWLRGIQPGARKGKAGWEFVFDGSGANIVDLPTYRFQRRTYWLDSDMPTTRAPTTTQALTPPPTPSLSGKSGLGLVAVDEVSQKTSDLGCATPKSDVGHIDTPELKQSPSTWQDEMSTLPTKDRHAALLSKIQEQVAAVLGFDDVKDLSSTAWDAPLTELGCDSVLGIMLQERLGRFSGVQMPPNMIFEKDTSTTLALVDYVLARV